MSSCAGCSRCVRRIVGARLLLRTWYRWPGRVLHGRRAVRGAIRARSGISSVGRGTGVAIGVLIVRIVWVLLRWSLWGRGRCLAFLFFVDRHIWVDFPQTSFTNLTSFFESFATDKIVPDTTLPAVSCTSVFEPGIHLLHGIVNLLQVHHTSR